jgi:hypothetical protein
MSAIFFLSGRSDAKEKILQPRLLADASAWKDFSSFLNFYKKRLHWTALALYLIQIVLIGKVFYLQVILRGKVKFLTGGKSPRVRGSVSAADRYGETP